MRRISVGLLLLAAACTKPIEQEWSFASEGGSQCAPVLVADMLVFGNEGGYVHAIDRQGSNRWSFSAHRDVIGTPAYYKGLVLFGSADSVFYAVNAANGREHWKLSARDRIKGAPVIDGDKVIFGSYDKRLYAVNAANGKLVWRFPAPTVAAPAAAPSQPTDTAQPVPAAAPPPPEITPGEFSYARPTVVDGTVYVGNLDGYLYAIDAETGAFRWRFQTGAGITSGATHDQGVLYFGSNDHNLYALDLATRQPRWKLETGDEVNASPLLADGTLYVGGVDGVFYAIDAASGQARWKHKTNGRIVGGAAVYQSLVFFGSGPGDGGLYALRRETGEQAWAYQTQSKIEASPVVDGNRLYQMVGDGRLLAFVINKLP